MAYSVSGRSSCAMRSIPELNFNDRIVLKSADVGGFTHPNADLK